MMSVEKFPAQNTEENQNATTTPTKEDIRKEREETLKKVEDIVTQATTGTLKLSTPFMSDNIEITELRYDFKAITGLEFAEAMDSDNSRKSDSFRITGKQALALFAVAVSKCEKHCDKEDVLRGLSIEDTVAAIQAATVFFRAASQAGNLRTTRE